MEAWFIWHRNLHKEHMTRVGAGCNACCVAQKKQGRSLWTEHIFVACLLSEDASSVGDGVAACNCCSLDVGENNT